ncbi:hypothetical protein [Bacillus cereus]|uniref:hypothetical protein n=1 Tax=Bacillus cereus TaxID=1396 RepID=UPI0015D4CCC5|nr:hypothetical protein [Bacillus cereus]MEB8803858.1 hypothetical protein [Bacillus cereus]
MIKFSCTGDIQVDKEWQRREGIRKLELTLTEEGDVGTVSIERYLFACNWSKEDEKQ